MSGNVHDNDQIWDQMYKIKYVILLRRNTHCWIDIFDVIRVLANPTIKEYHLPVIILKRVQQTTIFYNEIMVT